MRKAARKNPVSLRGEKISIQIPGSIWVFTGGVAVSGPQLMLCSAVYLSPPATLQLNK